MYLKFKNRGSKALDIDEKTIIKYLENILGYIKPYFFENDKNSNCLQEPELNLFFWAVFSNRCEIAKIFWRLGKVRFS
jgi:hypothetical protein